MNRLQAWVDWLVFRATWILCWVCCSFYVRLRTSGTPSIPRQGGLLILSNHQSFLDPVVIGLTSPRKARFAARSSLFRFRPLGAYLSALGGIALNRDGVATSGIKESLKILSRGDTLVYFPEGTRSEDGAMQPFRKGVGLVLRRSEVSVTLCGISGAYDVWPREQAIPGPGDVWVHYQRWHYPRNWREMDEDELTRILEDAVHETVEEADRRRRQFQSTRAQAALGVTYKCHAEND